MPSSEVQPLNRRQMAWRAAQDIADKSLVNLGLGMPLAVAIGKWKEWTAKRVLSALGAEAPLWQAEFFDHVLRSGESRSEKWNYVRENPVRAGLVAKAEEWPYAGSIDFE